VSRKDLTLSAAALCLLIVLTGCGMGLIATSGGGGTLSLQGQVHGGQQGVAGSTVQLYTVGSGGNGTAATVMLTQAVTTDSGGNFGITGDYTCGENSSGSPITSSNQVYLVATGGDPGVGKNNPALTMVAALGPCGNLSASTYVFVNELTTVAAAWALAPFATSAGNIAASGTNSAGITNAFVDAGLLVNTSAGAVAILPSNLTTETGKLNALADALASCVNSDGTTACNPLFTAATVGTTAPTDTFSAALNIVKNPGQNVTAVYGAIGTYVPFATTLAAAPNDWTMSLTVTGGGLFTPTALGIDKENNVWVANYYGPLSAFSAQGTPLSATGFGASGGLEITQVYGLAVDSSDNIWVTNQEGYQGLSSGSITKFYGASSGQIGVSPQPTGYADLDCFPAAVAADPGGDIFVANQGCSSGSIYNSTGGSVSADVGYYALLQYPAFPNFIAVDGTGGFWLSDNDNTIAHVAPPTDNFPNGYLLSHPDCCDVTEGIATDATGNVWVSDYDGGVSEVRSDGFVLINQHLGGGATSSFALAIDAGQNVWLTNLDDESISEIAGSAGSLAPGTPISPTTGVHGDGGYGLDAKLLEPFGIAPDQSGNIGVSNNGNDTVTMFFGLATPTATPLGPVPTAP
jgi:hypothetical protein